MSWWNALARCRYRLGISLVAAAPSGQSAVRCVAPCVAGYVECGECPASRPPHFRQL